MFHSLSFALIFLLGLSSLLKAQVLPLIKAKTGGPVVQELLGGCSLRCAFGWETVAIASGQKPQPVYTLDDNDASTAWIDAAPKQGTRIEFRFPKKLPAELNDMPFYGFEIASGVIQPLANFKDHARIKMLRAYCNGRALFDVRLADTWRWQQIDFDDIMLREGDVFALEILEVYPGVKDSHSAITEIVLKGAH